jgi:hypothetical protein
MLRGRARQASEPRWWFDYQAVLIGLRRSEPPRRTSSTHLLYGETFS